MIKRIIPLALLSIYGHANFANATEPKINLNLSPVVVTGTRIEQNSFDLPMSINAVSGETVTGAQQQVHLSESAARIPGIVVNNRNHGAQELSISSRGFGPRSQFGVRGIRLYTDGMPLTMPDGLGVSSAMNLDNASSIEFLRGPFSALYGNSSGGVVQLFTKNGGPETELAMGAFYGSYGTHRETTTLSGQISNVNYSLNASHYETNGYRDWSGYKKDFMNAKIAINLSDSTKLTLIAIDVNQPYVRDPGGLTAAEFKSSPRVAASGYQSAKTHKEMEHSQFGVILDHKISEADLLKTMVYYGERSNYQSFNVGSASGYNRDFGGFDIKWTHQGTLLEKPLNFTIGLNYDKMRDDRYRYAPGSAINGQVPATATKSRNELNEAYNFDQYAQAQWDLIDNWSLHAGIRHSKVTFDNTDKKAHAYDNKRAFEKTTPVAGIVYKVNPTFNLYANAGRGFETPTFIETEYSSTAATAPNITIQPSSSKNFEIGAKAFLTDNVLMNLAIFKTFTEKEIIMSTFSSDAAVYANAGDTERKGIELSVDANLGNNIKSYVAYSYLDAEFKDSFTSQYASGSNQNVQSGYKIPGTYKNRTYAEISWRHPGTGFFTSLEGIYSSKVYTNDVNTSSADAYAVFNWKGGFQQKLDKWSFSEFIRVDNLTNKDFVSSVRVNDQNSRFYEPGLPANWTVGLNASYKF
jgi:iron complex outermembrane receptor protein